MYYILELNNKHTLILSFIFQVLVIKLGLATLEVELFKTTTVAPLEELGVEGGNQVPPAETFSTKVASPVLN